MLDGQSRYISLPLKTNCKHTSVEVDHWNGIPGKIATTEAVAQPSLGGSGAAEEMSPALEKLRLQPAAGHCGRAERLERRS